MRARCLGSLKGQHGRGPTMCSSLRNWAHEGSLLQLAAEIDCSGTDRRNSKGGGVPKEVPLEMVVVGVPCESVEHLVELLNSCGATPLQPKCADLGARPLDVDQPPSRSLEKDFDSKRVANGLPLF